MTNQSNASQGQLFPVKHSTKSPRVLIVDDEPLARDTLEALLYREGYELLFATSGIDVLQRMPELAPDVILLDVMMPQMTGLELCQHLKKSAKFRHIPIILVTALDGPEELVRGLNAGADEFISKPVNGHELRARIRSMLRIKAQYDALEHTLQLRELLSNIIVHDMRNPLAVILIYIQLLKRKTGSATDQERYLELIHTESRQLNTFLDDILMLATMGKDNSVLERAAVDMTKFALELDHKYRTIADLQGVRFELIQATDSPPLIYIDINLFQRALDNLITNALKTSPTNSKITLWIEYPRQSSQQDELPMLRVKVLDEGVSIPAEDQERIFDNDQIVNMRQSDRSQAGLGLAFCRMIIEAHGGRIFVTDNTPQGSVFTLEFF